MESSADNHLKDYTINTFNALTSLLVILNSNDEDDTDFVIAKYLLENVDSIKNTSIFQIADDCFVSRSSVQRFIKNLGYESYTHFKHSFDEVIRHQKSFIGYTDHTHYEQFMKDSIDAMMTDIDATCKEATFSELADKIHQAENVYFLTAEDSSAAPRMFQHQLLVLGKMVRIFTSASCHLDFLKQLHRNDLIIVSSLTGNFALVINDMLKKAEVGKCLITVNRTTAFEDTYDTIHYLSTNQSFSQNSLTAARNVYNTYGLTYFFDRLYHLYFRRYG